MNAISKLRADASKRPPLTEIHRLLTLGALGSHRGVFACRVRVRVLCGCVVVLLCCSLSLCVLCLSVGWSKCPPRSLARSLSLVRARLLCIPRHEHGGSIHPLVNITPPPHRHDARPRASITWCVWMDTSQLVRQTAFRKETINTTNNEVYGFFFLLSFGNRSKKMNTLTSLKSLHLDINSFSIR